MPTNPQQRFLQDGPTRRSAGCSLTRGVRLRPPGIRSPLHRLPPLPPVDPEDLTRLAEAYRRGYSISDLAEAMSMAYESARKRLIRAGCKLRQPGGGYQTRRSTLERKER